MGDRDTLIGALHSAALNLDACAIAIRKGGKSAGRHILVEGWAEQARAAAAGATGNDNDTYAIAPIHQRIRSALYRICDDLGAPIDVLAAIGSWGDTMPESDIAEMLEDYLKSGTILHEAARPDFKVIQGDLAADPTPPSEGGAS